MNEPRTLRLLTFEKLWLISERELSAREIVFSPGKNLLTGGNGTGKSRVTKHCFWALGCEVHKRVWGGWDATTAAALFFNFSGRSYVAIRRNDHYGLLDSDGEFIVATGRYSKYQEALCGLLNYDLTLKRPQSNKFSLAGLPYLAVPFYLDQDGGWGTSWNTFDRLGQFEKWIDPVFSMFIGLSPNAYLVAKAKRQELTVKMNDIRKELAVQQKAFAEVSKVLADDAPPSIDPLRFKTELRSLATAAGRVQAEQRKLQEKVTQLATEVARLESDLALTRSAQTAVVGDLVYLTSLPAKKALVCPTCGWEHQNSFHARLDLGTDADALGELVGELTGKLLKARDKHSKMLGELSYVDKQLASFEQEFAPGDKRVELKELIAAYSRKSVSNALATIESSAQNHLRPLQADWEAQDLVVRRFDDKERRKQVKKAYLHNINEFMSDLKAPPEERISAGSLGKRPPTGGSEMPRSVLAVHLAMLHTSYEYSDTPILPLVVDTFQHSGQDLENLPAMINAAYKSALPGQQTIFAAETVPETVNLEGVHMHQYSEKKKFLQRDAYGALAPDFLRWLTHIDLSVLAETLGTNRTST